MGSSEAEMTLQSCPELEEGAWVPSSIKAIPGEG